MTSKYWISAAIVVLTLTAVSPVLAQKMAMCR
jgi:hypothetical protein